MENFADILHMGGYAKFVWTAYGLAAFGIVGILALSLKSWKDHEREFGHLKSSRDQETGS